MCEKKEIKTKKDKANKLCFFIYDIIEREHIRPNYPYVFYE